MTFASVARSLGVAVLAVGLVACGGGEGFGPGSPSNPGNPGGNGNGPTAKISVSFDHNQIKDGSPGTATIQLDANGTGLNVANQVIQVTTTAGTLVPASGLVLTDGSGAATIRLQDAGVAAAGTLTAALSGDPSVTGEATFNLAGDASPSSTPLPKLVVSFANNAITGANPGLATLTLSANGTSLNVANQVLQVTATAGTLDPASGMVLTDASGQATITLKDGGTKTAGILTAKLYSDNSVTADAAFTMDGTGQQVVQPKLTVTLAPIAISAANPGLATLTLSANGTGLNVANQVLQVTTTAGTLDPASGMVLTDASGQATIALKDNGQKTAGTLTASLSDNAAVTAHANFSLAGDGSVTPTQPILTVSFANNAISKANPGLATLTLSANGTGLNVANQVLQVTTTAGALDPASGMVLTDASGQATITLKDNGIKTAGVLSAQLNGNGAVAGQAAFSLAGDGTATPVQPILTVSFANNAITGANPGLATLTLSANGTSLNVANQVLQVTTTAGTLDPASGMVLTNASGQATITLKDGGTKTAGILTATLESDGTVTGSAAFQMDGTGLPKLSAIALIDTSVSPPNSDYGTATQPITMSAPATVQVTLMDASNHPIPEANLSFALSSTVGTLSATSALTAANGVATVTLGAGSTQGAGTLTVSYLPGNGQPPVTASKSFAVDVGTGAGPRLSTPELTDSANVQAGTTTNPITDVNPATVRVTLSGVPDAANKVIAFTLIGPTGVGALDPATGTALTDDNGIAIITLRSGTAAGAATLKASYSADPTVTSQVDFTTRGAGQAVQLELALGTDSGNSFAAGKIAPPTGLVSGSTASISVNVVDTGNNNQIYTDAPIQVTFTSACFQGGRASFNPVTATTISGTAQTSYQPANGCTNDTLSATALVNGKTLTAATDPFAVTQSPPNSIRFVAASPAVIGVKGASGAGTAESSILTFLVADQNGNPVGPGLGVTFTVQTPAGGFGIANGTASVVDTQAAQTDSNGQVTVTVNSGSVPMVGTIKAELTANPTIFGTGSVSVQQGVATQDRFVIAVATLNPPAGNHVGVTDQVTARAADRVGNWVPDGTRINFDTKLGDIDASCTTVNGTCSVTWTSQGAQPILFDVNRATSGCAAFTLDAWFRHGLPSQPWDMACNRHDRYGVNVITAWTTGEESFSDVNGNNVFDDGEPFVDLGEAFDDNNINGIHDATNGAFSENYQDLNTNGAYDGANGKYNGLSCAETSTTCDRSLINVRRATTMVLSTDGIQMRVWDGAIPSDLAISNPTAWGTGFLTSATADATDLTPSSSEISVAVADLNGNAPAINTQITVTVTPPPGDQTSKVLPPTSCTLGNAVDHLECSFAIVGVTGAKFTITAESGGDPNLSVSRTLTVQ